MEPQHNKPLYNKVLSITNNILCPSNSKYVKKNFNIVTLMLNKFCLYCSQFIKLNFPLGQDIQDSKINYTNVDGHLSRLLPSYLMPFDMANIRNCSTFKVYILSES